MRPPPDPKRRTSDVAEGGVPNSAVVNIGITGHRSGALTAPLVRTLRPIVFTVFRQLHEAALRIRKSEATLPSDAEARLRLHTALATGADQIAAICARSSGYFVRALLPFEPSEYRKDFADDEELARFEQALEAADEIVALPGDRSDLEGAYVLVGESLVGTADILIAIWDGDQGNGPGGTAHVVEMALQRAVPVLHIDIDHDSDTVRVRALVGGDATAPFGASLHDPDLYSRVLNGASRLGREANDEALPAFELDEQPAV